MLILHVQTKIPKDDFGRNLAANNIREALTNQLIEALSNSANPENDFMEISKSPAFFGVNNAFSLMEYFKNSVREGATQLDLYVSADTKGVTCIAIDNGNGITKGGLFDALTKDNKLVNYIETQLKSNNGEEKEHIKSSNGGEGLGLAIISRVLRTGTGTLEIGNTSNLPNEIIQRANIDTKAHPKGAVIVVNSPLYTTKLEHEYKKAKSNIRQDSNHRFLNYCDSIEQEFGRSSATSSPVSTTSAYSSESEDEQSDLDSPSSTKKIFSWLKPCTKPSGLTLDLEGLRIDDDEETLNIDSPASSPDRDEPTTKKPPPLDLKGLDFEDNEVEDETDPQSPRPS